MPLGGAGVGCAWGLGVLMSGWSRSGSSSRSAVSGSGPSAQRRAVAGGGVAAALSAE